MKFVQFNTFDVAKAAEVSAASDKFWASPPPGVKMLADYVCLGIPFSGVPPNTVVSLAVVEAESAEALTAVTYALALAGASLWNVPVLELPVAGAAKVEKKFRR